MCLSKSKKYICPKCYVNIVVQVVKHICGNTKNVEGIKATPHPLSEFHHCKLNNLCLFKLPNVFAPFAKYICSKRKIYLKKYKQARKLQATLVPVRNYHPPTDSLTGVRCRATSVAKNNFKRNSSRVDTLRGWWSLALRHLFKAALKIHNLYKKQPKTHI